MSRHDSEHYEDESIKYAWTIPIACGIFTFVYWFILTPILWNAISVEDDSETFGIFMMAMAIFWGVFVGLFMCIWWFKRRSDKPCKEKAAKDLVSIVKKDSDDSTSNHSRSPPFPTVTETVQPSDTPISYKARCSLNRLHPSSEKDMTTISLSSYPVQPENTPSLYNAETGRRSFEQGHADSGNVSVPNAANSSSTQEAGILMVKKSKSAGTKVRRKISSTDSEGEKGDWLKGPESRNSAPRCDGIVTVETAIIEHNRQSADMPDTSKEAVDDSQFLRLCSSDSYHGLPEMNSFDGYLHLTTVDTPLTPPTGGTCPESSGLTPRELFFIDLIRQAEENERAPGIRRSMGDEVVPRRKSTSENRKSMPLYLHLINSPSSTSGVPRLPSVEGRPSDSKDPVSATVSRGHGISSPTCGVTSDEVQSSLKDSEQQCVDPAGLPSEEDSTITGPAGTKDGEDDSGGEYFIANIVRNKSVTSEAYLNVGDGGTKVVEPGTTVQWDLVVGDSHGDDDYLSDDCVFEDDVAVKKNKK
jgi:hypothetical protein